MSFRAFEAALAKAVDEGKIAGAVALVTDRDGVTYEHAAGLRAVGQPAAMDGATVFWIASMTKAVVSVAALQLVERGKLTLDGDLGELCPDLKDLQVLEGVAEGKPRLRPAKGFVTLRQLLSHTSGFAYTFTHPEFLAFSQTEGALDPNSGTRAAHRQPLMFDPGQGWIYGIGIDWAGIVIEAASGQRLDAYLAENIFAPLAMFDTGFALSEGQAPRKASVHVRGPDGSLIAIPFGLPANPGCCRAVVGSIRRRPTTASSCACCWGTAARCCRPGPCAACRRATAGPTRPATSSRPWPPCPTTLTSIRTWPPATASPP